jgi:hypothetical protein
MGQSSYVLTVMSHGAAQPGTPTVPHLSKPSNRSWMVRKIVGLDSDQVDSVPETVHHARR